MNNSKTRNIVLADTAAENVAPFAQALAEISGEPFEINTAITNRKQYRGIEKLRVLSAYFLFPLKHYFHRKQYNYVVGWQQFFATNYAMWCRLLGSKHAGKVIIGNFTYKKRNGSLKQKLYDRYMRYALNSKAVYRIHVLSQKYADSISEELNLPISKFIVTSFGTNDMSGQWLQLPSPVDYPYTLSIGRSNRDFDFLLDLWSQSPLAGERLIIISDTWQPKKALPDNVVHLTDVTGNDSFPYIANCKASVVSMDDPLICSGDTVLINSMMMSKPIVVTAPSAIADVYVDDDVTGLCIAKDTGEASRVAQLLGDSRRMAQLGAQARAKYLDNYTLAAMGRQLMTKVMDSES